MISRFSLACSFVSVANSGLIGFPVITICLFVMYFAAFSKAKDTNFLGSLNSMSTDLNFAIENNEMVGLIHGKIIDDIGLICHVYIKENYRKKNVLALLNKNLVLWFKNNNISILDRYNFLLGCCRALVKMACSMYS